MTFDAIPTGQSVFVDANPLLYYFTSHPRFGAACQKLLDRIENKDLVGATSAHIVSEVVHRLMTIEACQLFNWPAKGIAQRLRKHPAEVQQLTRARQAADEIALVGLDVVSVSKDQVSLAIDISRQTGLLSGDALVIAVMQDQGLVNLASNDSDFDRMTGITRFSPA